MSECLSDQHLQQLQAGELPKKAAAVAEAHLADCPDCFARWEGLQEDLATQLKIMSPTEPPRDLLHDYRFSLKRRFVRDSMWAKWRNRSISRQRETAVPFGGMQWGFALAFLLLAFVLTIWPDGSTSLEQPPHAAALPQSISYQEVEMIRAYLLENEMLLLQLQNSNEEDLGSAENREFLSSVAGQLAGRSMLMQKKAIDLNDPSLLRLVSSLDILLVELSNAEAGEFIQCVGFIQQIVSEMDILAQLRRAIEAAEEPDASLSV